jgi:hypothetical protein
LADKPHPEMNFRANNKSKLKFTRKFLSYLVIFR